MKRDGVWCCREGLVCLKTAQPCPVSRAISALLISQHRRKRAPDLPPPSTWSPSSAQPPGTATVRTTEPASQDASPPSKSDRGLLAQLSVTSRALKSLLSQRRLPRADFAKSAGVVSLGPISTLIASFCLGCWWL